MPPPRTMAATLARMRVSEHKMADRLRERGWQCFPPDDTDHEVALSDLDAVTTKETTP